MIGGRGVIFPGRYRPGDPQIRHEIPGVVALVGTQRLLVGAR